MKDHDWGNSDFPSVFTGVTGEQPYQLNIHKAMGPDRISLRIKMDFKVHQRPWESGEVPADWKLTNIIPSCIKDMREDTGNYTFKLTLIPGKVMEKIVLERC